MLGWGCLPGRETAAPAPLLASASFAVSKITILSPQQPASAPRRCPGDGAADALVLCIAGSHPGVGRLGTRCPAGCQGGTGLAGPHESLPCGQHTPGMGTGCLQAGGSLSPPSSPGPGVGGSWAMQDPRRRQTPPVCAVMPQHQDLWSCQGGCLRLVGDRAGQLRAGREGVPSCLPAQPVFAEAAFCLPALGHRQHGLCGQGRCHSVPGEVAVSQEHPNVGDWGAPGTVLTTALCCRCGSSPSPSGSTTTT